MAKIPESAMAAVLSPAAQALNSIRQSHRRGEISDHQRAELKSAVLSGKRGVVIDGVLSPAPRERADYSPAGGGDGAAQHGATSTPEPGAYSREPQGYSHGVALNLDAAGAFESKRADAAEWEEKYDGSAPVERGKPLHDEESKSAAAASVTIAVDSTQKDQPRQRPSLMRRMSANGRGQFKHDRSKRSKEDGSDGKRSDPTGSRYAVDKENSESKQARTKELGLFSGMGFRRLSFGGGKPRHATVSSYDASAASAQSKVVTLPPINMQAAKVAEKNAQRKAKIAAREQQMHRARTAGPRSPAFAFADLSNLESAADGERKARTKRAKRPVSPVAIGLNLAAPVSPDAPAHRPSSASEAVPGRGGGGRPGGGRPGRRVVKRSAKEKEAHNARVAAGVAAAKTAAAAESAGSGAGQWGSERAAAEMPADGGAAAAGDVRGAAEWEADDGTAHEASAAGTWDSYYGQNAGSASGGYWGADGQWYDGSAAAGYDQWGGAPSQSWYPSGQYDSAGNWYDYSGYDYSQQQWYGGSAGYTGGGSGGRGAAARDDGTWGVAKEAYNEVFSSARHGRHDKVKAAIEGGMPVDATDEHGNTLLMVASQNGLKRIVKLCLRKGADINATNHMGNTALHFAFAYQYTQLAAYLVSKGADASARNLQGMLPEEGIGA